MEMSTHMSTLYLDIYIYLFLYGEVCNFCLISILVFSRNTREEIYLDTYMALDVICTNSKDIIVYI